MMEDFLNKVEDFLEKGAELNKFTLATSDNKKVFLFKIGRESLTLIKHLTNETAILNGEMGSIPNGFTNHVMRTLKPEEV
jgi:hypothetical protein